jgi:hypothetical protein
MRLSRAFPLESFEEEDEDLENDEKKDAGDPGREGLELNDLLDFLKGSEREMDGRGVGLGLIDGDTLGFGSS